MKKRFYDILFAVLAGLLVFTYSKQPVYNWDMIAYMGIVVEYAHPADIQSVHDIVYDDLKHEVPAKVYRDLTAPIEDREECLTSARAFEKELVFFRVKPLYCWLVYALYHSGVHLVTATLIPSLVAAFFILVLLYQWLALYVKRAVALAGALLLGLYPPFKELADLSSPDALSNLFILACMLMAARGYKGWWLPVLLVLSILARVDNFIFAGCMGYFIYLHGKKGVLMSLGIIAALIAGSIFLMPLLTGDSLDWFNNFAFMASAKDYIQHWKDVLYTFRHSPFDIAWAIMIVILLFTQRAKSATIIRVIAITSVLHMILFPSLQERFFVAYEFATVIMLLSYVVATYKMPGKLRPATDSLP